MGRRRPIGGLAADRFYPAPQHALRSWRHDGEATGLGGITGAKVNVKAGASRVRLRSGGEPSGLAMKTGRQGKQHRGRGRRDYRMTRRDFGVAAAGVLIGSARFTAAE